MPDLRGVTDLMTAGEVTDGRGLRSIRTRQAIIDAFLRLLRDGELSPSSVRIAEAAGVSPRSIFVHFVDIEAIYLAATLRHLELHPELDTPTPVVGDIDERIDLLVSRRSAAHASIGPIRRACMINEHESETLQRVMDGLRAFNSSDVEQLFAAELSRRTPASRRTVSDAIAVASSFATWDHMERMGATAAQAAAAMRCLVAGALCSPGAD